MSAAAAHSYAQRRLLELLGIERYVARPRAVPRLRIAVACERAELARHAKLARHLAAALGVGVEEFGKPAGSAHVICFGTAAPEGPSTSAPPFATLRASPEAKRAFWQSVRALRRAGH